MNGLGNQVGQLGVNGAPITQTATVHFAPTITTYAQSIPASSNKSEASNGPSTPPGIFHFLLLHDLIMAGSNAWKSSATKPIPINGSPNSPPSHSPTQGILNHMQLNSLRGSGLNR